MREHLEMVADSLIERWSRDRTLDLQTGELEVVQAFLRDIGIQVRPISDGRFEVEAAGTRKACSAAHLLLLGLRRLVDTRRATEQS